MHQTRKALRYGADQAFYKGNAPGLPHQFQYVDGSGLANNREFLDPSAVGANHITQIVQTYPVQETYGSMVPDIPFDRVHEDKKRSLTLVYGLGAIAVGIILLMRR